MCWDVLAVWGGSALIIAKHTGPQQGVMIWEVISFDSRTHLVSFLAQWQHSFTMTTFYNRFWYSFICDNLDLLFNMIMPGRILTCYYEFSPCFPNTSLASLVYWSLSHRKHLGRDEKAIATISEYWRFSPTVEDNLAWNSAGQHRVFLLVNANAYVSLFLGQRWTNSCFISSLCNDRKKSLNCTGILIVYLFIFVHDTR